MQKVVGVRFKSAGKIYYFDPLGFNLEKNDHVVVETARGLEYGMVATSMKYLEEDEIIKELKPVIRKATNRDTRQHQENMEKAEEALEICRKEVEKEGLEMKLIRAEYTFNASKVIFYFTADGRVDFRELVKKLAAIFRIRIELRQIGVRDESKIIGGIGPCGCELCCNRWLGDFQPVSIKMAKEQGLSLNPSKISGICGRLLCCLQYESEFYEDAIGRLPKVSDRVETEDGIGTVERLNVLKETALVKFDKDGDIAFKEYKCSDIEVKGTKKGCPNRDKCPKHQQAKKDVQTGESAADSQGLRIVEDFAEETVSESGKEKPARKRKPRNRKRRKPKTPQASKNADTQAKKEESPENSQDSSKPRRKRPRKNSRKNRPPRNNSSHKSAASSSGKKEDSGNARAQDRPDSERKTGKSGSRGGRRRRNYRRNNRNKNAQPGVKTGEKKQES